MILQEDLIPVGQIQKAHGIHGELAFQFSSDVFDREKAPCFLLEIDSIPVPFFIESYRLKTGSTGLLKFEDVNSEEDARKLVGLTLYLGKEYLEAVDDEDIELNYFAGFVLNDKQAGDIGQILDVDQSTDNALFVVESTDPSTGETDEILIPVSDSYILKIDHEARIIYMDLPEGLLDL